MREIPVEQAVGHVLCHDMTQIVPGKFKGPRFRKGHVVTAEDVPVLLSMGKRSIYVWEMRPGVVHENDAALQLCRLAEARAARMRATSRRGRSSSRRPLTGAFA